MATQNGRSKNLLFRSVVLISAAFLLITACGNANEEFCELALTSSQARTETEINEYYTQLEAVAPDEIKDDVTTLRQDWNSVSFPLGGGQVTRPDEVSNAGRNVHKFVGEVCGTEGGVYLIYPEIGW